MSTTSASLLSSSSSAGSRSKSNRRLIFYRFVSIDKCAPPLSSSTTAPLSALHIVPAALLSGRSTRVIPSESELLLDMICVQLLSESIVETALDELHTQHTYRPERVAGTFDHIFTPIAPESPCRYPKQVVRKIVPSAAAIFIWVDLNGDIYDD